MTHPNSGIWRIDSKYQLFLFFEFRFHYLFSDFILHKTYPTDAFVLNFRKCMTRSSVKELTKPFDEPEKVFHSLKRLFNTRVLDYSSPIELDYFSDKDEASEEEVTETMGENTTMEEYMNKTRADYSSGVAKPKFDDDTNFELKSQFLKELRENAFSGSEDEDANDHVE
jgi:hypothetical protein